MTPLLAFLIVGAVVALNFFIPATRKYFEVTEIKCEMPGGCETTPLLPEGVRHEVGPPNPNTHKER